MKTCIYSWGLPNLAERVKSEIYNWYWVIVALTLGSAIAVLAVDELGSQAIIRWVLASLLVLFLPGYAFMRALSPSKASNVRQKDEMDGATRYALSVVMSIVTVSVFGLILDLTPWGVSVDSLVLSLTLFTLFCSTIGLAREREVFRSAKIDLEIAE